jgi:hypothetical protein
MVISSKIAILYDEVSLWSVGDKIGLLLDMSSQPGLPGCMTDNLVVHTK